MPIKFHYFLLTFIVLLSSCGSLKKSTIKTTALGDFSKAQNELILSGKATEPMRVFLITDYQDSLLLRQNCDSVIFHSNNTTLNHFIQRLYKTVTDSSSLGVGIAAPQVGLLKRIIWVQRFDKPEFPFEVYINPSILKYTDKKQPCPEGCLSIPNIKATTTDRAYAILLKYQSIDGLEHMEMIESFTSVIFQHEIDHLNGILFIDHLKKEVKDAKSKQN